MRAGKRIPAHWRWMIALAVLVAVALAVGISPFYAVLAWGVVAIVGEFILGAKGGWKWANAEPDPEGIGDDDFPSGICSGQGDGYRFGPMGYGYYSADGFKIHD